MVAVGGTVMAEQSDIEPERNSIHTLVAIKHDGKWHFTAFQNSRAQFIGRPEESQALTEESTARDVHSIVKKEVENR